MAGMSDTSPEAERVLIEVSRRMTPAQKWRLLGRMYRDARALHAAGLRYRNPAITPREVTADWIRRNLGIDLPVPVSQTVRSDIMPTLQDFAEVAQVFTRLGIAYALGGSMASSVFSIGRHTNDADVMVEPFPGKEAELIRELGPDYYISEPAIRQALRARSSFNFINTATGFKVDVFIRPDSPFEQSAMARRINLDVEGISGQKIDVLSPEDIALSKLRWYRLGNEASEQQWKDVLNVLKVQGPHLDRAYLERWARDLDVEDLLARAWAEAAIGQGEG
jgi:hypothetical protein